MYSDIDLLRLCRSRATTGTRSSAGCAQLRSDGGAKLGKGGRRRKNCGEKQGGEEKSSQLRINDAGRHPYWRYLPSMPIVPAIVEPLLACCVREDMAPSPVREEDREVVRPSVRVKAVKRRNKMATAMILVYENVCVDDAPVRRCMMCDIMAVSDAVAMEGEEMMR